MISNNLKQIASFSYVHEAYLAKGFLEASDIPVFITDEHTINMQWLYSSALGGVRLLVPIAYQKEALELLSTDFSDNLNKIVNLEKIKCSACASENVEPYTIGKKPAFIVFLLLGFPLFFYKHGIKCNKCGKVSKI